MKGKKLLSLLLALSLSVALAACGGGSGPASGDGGDAGPDAGQDAAPTDGSGYTAKSLTVNIWDNNQRAGLQQIADEWSEKSGVDVSIEVIAWDAYWTLLEAGASGGQLPDVFWMHINEAEKYMASDIDYFRRTGTCALFARS